MKTLRTVMAEKMDVWRAENRNLMQAFGERPVSRVTVKDLFRGMRGVTAVVCDTSRVDPEAGLFIRERPVSDLLHCSGESIFYLLCTGELPDAKAERSLREEIESRSELPNYVREGIENLPDGLHPMALLSIATLMMQRESAFQAAYARGVPRDRYWESMLEDALDLIARLPVIAAGIFRRKLRGLDGLDPQPGLGFSNNFVRMLGLSDPEGRFEAYIRRFVVVHSDHEGANASVLTARITHSALTDVFAAVSGAMNCLAGHLHGRANQESIQFILDIEERFHGIPDEADLAVFIREHLDNRRIIPGFGHAVLRGPDPRYRALSEFGRRLCPDCAVFAIAGLLEKVATAELKSRGKVGNPYPNIDAISGALLHYFGMTEHAFYTVMFSVAQSLGLCAQLVIESGLTAALFRPRSVTREQVRRLADQTPE
jgi:citrate synthase